MKEDRYIEINKKLWDKRSDVHFDSDFYDNDTFIEGRNSLNSIELELLGDIKGKSILHLQCHFGQDSISLSRMGARVTGVDLSEKSISYANILAKKTDESVEFICCDLYDLPNHLNDTFDIVFTSYGTIGWLPDIKKWANIVSTYLKKGGFFVFAEFHPVIWMFDEHFKEIKYEYFNKEAIVEIDENTYADKTSDVNEESISWNHGMSEVVSALLKHNLNIVSLKEFDYSPYNCFNETEEFETGKFRIMHLGNKIPMVYSIKAIKW